MVLNEEDPTMPASLYCCRQQRVPPGLLMLRVGPGMSKIFVVLQARDTLMAGKVMVD